MCPGYLLFQIRSARTSLWKRDATDKEIEEAARLAQIYDEIMRFPQGMNTVIGERGITCPVDKGRGLRLPELFSWILPFSSWMSPFSVDIQTEEKILEGLEKFLRGKTSF